MAVAIAAVLALGTFYEQRANSELRVPKLIDVLYTRTGGPRGPLVRELRDITEAARLNKADETVQQRATSFARKAIEQSRAASDPRMLGRAQAALAPWWDDAQPPPAVLLLRAIIRQSLHEFGPALVDLDAYVQAVPADPQGWLTRAVVLTVRGEFARAEASCLPLRELAPEVFSATCLGGVRCSTGHSREALIALETALARARRPDVSQTTWAYTTTAECLTRVGESERAERLLKEVLRLDPSDGYARSALADVLYETARFKESADLVRDYSNVDNLLLRLVIAEKAAKLPDVERSAKTLRDRYDASRQRGDTVHMREEARFALVVDEDPKRAVTLALRNWDVQKEPSDLRILWETGVAAGDPTALQLVRTWMNDTKLEDPKVTRWLLKGTP